MDNLKSTLEYTNKKKMGLWDRLKYRFGRLPAVGEKCFFANKQFMAYVDSVDRDGCTVCIKSDSMICTNGGAWMSRWTTNAKVHAFRWSEVDGYWVLGQGPWPKKKIAEYISGGGLLITPEPVQLKAGMVESRMGVFSGADSKGDTK